MVRFLLALVATALITSTSLAAESEPMARVGRVYVKSIWSDGRHNGFPGIAKFGEHYYVTCRNADSHKAGENTKILVIRSRADDLTKWEQVAEFPDERDCRDPLLFVAGDRLRVVWHSKEDFTSDTADGTTWTPTQQLAAEFVEPASDSRLVFSSQRRWLFRIRKGPDGAYYSLARCGITSDESRGRFGLILYRSTDGFTFKGMHTYGRGPTLPMATAGGIGWGHEADVGWKADGTMVSAIRNGGPGVLSYASAPYEEWKALPNTNWPDFGGPALHTTRDGKGGMLVAARETPKIRPTGTYPSKLIVRSVTAAGAIDPVYIPSSGDCGYNSFAPGRNPNEVLLCYYSSHEWPQPAGTGEHPANIYLAFLTIRHTQEAPPFADERPSAALNLLRTKKISIAFDRNDLSRVLAIISDELGVPIEIHGEDFRNAGITKNQTMGLNEPEQTVDKLLQVILKKANPDGQLIYTIKSGTDGKEMIQIVTRKGAAERKEQLLPEFERVPLKK